MPELSEERQKAPPLKDAWSIRPCYAYKDEYSDCTSLKARFHQYFVHGENIDCSQWDRDYENCRRYESSDGHDVAAGEAIVQSEAARRAKRMQAHYGNNTWKKRASPPADWSKPLPDWLAKRNENTYLEIKQLEMEGVALPTKPEQSWCVLM